MKTAEVVSLYQGLMQLHQLPDKFSTKFVYATNITKGRLQPIIENYGKVEQEIMEKHVKRDEKGEKIQAPNGGFFVEDPLAYTEEMKSVQEVDVDDIRLHQISLDEFPAELPANIMSLLLPLVKEPSVEQA